jgi:hypothetical protein
MQFVNRPIFFLFDGLDPHILRALNGRRIGGEHPARICV